MRGYLVDANHLGDAVKPVSDVRPRLYQVERKGWRIGTCIPVLCEVEAGIQRSRRQEYLRRNLRHLLNELLRLWPLGENVAWLYGELFMELRRAGRALSQIDVMLAALARHMKLTILTSDRDFEALPDIRTENWLT